MQLATSEGWRNLLLILEQATGMVSSKNLRPVSTVNNGVDVAFSSDSERLAKRLKGAKLG